MSKAITTFQTNYSRPANADISITIRRGGQEDEGVVARLSRLDSRTPLPAPWLIAEAGGEPLAVVSLSNGEVAADPFRHTQDLVELLRARAEHLHSAGLRPARRRVTTVFRAQQQRHAA